jgi:N-acetylmuramoyl-L-alanine amidase
LVFSCVRHSCESWKPASTNLSRGQRGSRLRGNNGWWGFVIIVAALLASAVPSFPAKPTTATDIEIVTKGEVTRFFADLSRATGYSASVLAEPYRVVIDLENVNFDLAPGIGQKSVGLVRQVRYGIMEKGKSRIMIDTTGPVLIKQSQLLPAKGKSKPRIAIDLVATTPEAFAAALARDSAAVASPETTASLPLIMPSSAVKPPEPKTDGRRVIVIDPGHGGIDPGAISASKTKEKDVVFAFAKVLQNALSEDGKYDVRLTRTDDSFMTLGARVAFTRAAKADLFIAIHADRVRGRTASGTTLYTLSEEASDEEAAALAQTENKVDILAGVDLGEQVVEVADVLIELVQRESKNHANLFSRSALRELKGVTTMTGKPLRSAGFFVLKAPDVPSVLIELGFLSSRSDEKKLKDNAWRVKMAKALTRAIDRHFDALGAVE